MDMYNGMRTVLRVCVQAPLSRGRVQARTDVRRYTYLRNPTRGRASSLILRIYLSKICIHLGFSSVLRRRLPRHP